MFKYTVKPAIRKGVLLLLHIYSQKTDSTAVLDPTTLYTATPTLYGSPSVTVRVWPDQNGCGFSFIGSDPFTDTSYPIMGGVKLVVVIKGGQGYRGRVRDVI